VRTYLFNFFMLEIVCQIYNYYVSISHNLVTMELCDLTSVKYFRAQNNELSFHYITRYSIASCVGDISLSLS